MFYDLNQTSKEISLKQIQRDHLTVGMIPLSQLPAILDKFQFPEFLLEECRQDSRHMQNSLSAFETYSFGIINIIHTNQLNGKRDRIGLFIKKNLVLIVDIFDEDTSTMEAFSNSIRHPSVTSITAGHFIHLFFRQLTFHDSRFYEDLEAEAERLDQAILSEKTGHFWENLGQLNHKLLILRNYYEQLVDLGASLLENENELFTQKDLAYFKMFTSRMTRYSDNIQVLREYTAQIRESYQAQQDYKLNDIMKLFTTVTVIFLPLTLLVGWYGMNFTNMPELHWRYSYAFVAVISILIVIVCIIWFRKKRFF